MIALTDGNDTASAVPPVEASKVAKDREITIYTVAMGDPTTVGEEKLDEQALKEVARMTGGQFFLAMNRQELAGIYDRLDQVQTREIKTVSHRPRRDWFYWPLLAALLLSLLGQIRAAWRSRSVSEPRDLPARLRVNPRTFELEMAEE